MKYYLLFFLLLGSLSACVIENEKPGINKEKTTESDPVPDGDDVLKLEKIESPHWTIVSFDTYGKRLDRIFLVIAKDKVFDYHFIQSLVCSLKENYPIQENTSLSFFTETKYAAYKDELFFDGKSELAQDQYEAWMNNYYLAEFQYNSWIYSTYPASKNLKGQSKKTMDICP